MRIVDITGTIQDGMWNYDLPYPEFHLKPMGNVPWADNEVYCEKFEGMNSQTGTYIETPAHYFGNENSYLMNDVPLEKLINMNCCLLSLDENDYSILCSKRAITAETLERCLGDRVIEEGSAILVGTGWGKKWMKEDYLKMSPFFTTDAMEWLINKKPSLIGTDFASWENIRQPAGFFPMFYKANILMLAPCINLESIAADNLRLTVLPLKIAGTCCVPCRAILCENGCEKND